MAPSCENIGAFERREPTLRLQVMKSPALHKNQPREVFLQSQHAQIAEAVVQRGQAPSHARCRTWWHCARVTMLLLL